MNNHIQKVSTLLINCHTQLESEKFLFHCIRPIKFYRTMLNCNSICYFIVR